MMRFIRLAFAGTSLALAGCSTVRGVGEDIESVADAGEDAID